MRLPGIWVEVVYAEPQRAILKSYRLEPGSCLADVIRVAALDADFSCLNVADAPLGIFGKLAPLTQLLQDGDRIEIYRRLAVDPKTARRARAQEAGKKT